MARMVRIDGTGPIKIEPTDKNVWICGCGLSRTMPFCDKTHKTTCVNEAPGTLYIYDDTRTTVIDTRPDTFVPPPPAS